MLAQILPDMSVQFNIRSAEVAMVTVKIIRVVVDGIFNHQ